MTKTILVTVAIASALLSGCSGAAPVANTAEDQTVARLVAGTAEPLAPLVPMTVAEIGRVLPGNFIDEGPYRCAEGPVRIQADGDFAATAFWGPVGGKSEISDGRIIFDDRGAPEHFRRVVLLYRDRRGRFFYRYEGESGDPHPLRVKPVASATPSRMCQPGENVSGRRG